MARRSIVDRYWYLWALGVAIWYALIVYTGLPFWPMVAIGLVGVGVMEAAQVHGRR